MSAGNNWFKDKTWSISGNKESTLTQLQQDVKQNDAVIYYPESTKEIAKLVASNQKSAFAVVCGGHSSSNVATWAYHSVSEGASCEGNDDGNNTIILDMKNMSSVTVDKESMEVTVGGGTTLGELAQVCSDAGGALPIGTGDTVGVCGYTLNGGLSGYFGKRLGMLGQRVVSMEIVLADGSIKNLTPTSSGDDGKLFHACLGAGSAMGVVTSLTFQMESESSFNTGGSIVVACGDKTSATPFLKRALQFMKNQVLSTSSCSMEIVIVTDYTVIINFMFYDTFTGDT